MAENDPLPPIGAVPPKPAEAAKVQPKKETVRINLPPKPTASPTIKLPTLAPGAPPPSMATASAAAPAAARAAAPAPPQPPAQGAPASRVAAAPAAAAVAQRPGPAAALPRPAAAPVAVAGLRTLDKVLLIGAVVASLAALTPPLFLVLGLFGFKDPTAP
jgi:hypothetical protein